jgi:uncharacterized protein YkwD
MTKSSGTALDRECRLGGPQCVHLARPGPRRCSLRGLLWGLLACCMGLAALPSRADVLFVVRVLREGGCGGALPAAPQLHHNPLLDRSAQEWAVGRTLTQAVDLSGYHAVSAAGLHVRGSEGVMLQRLERSACKTLVSQGLHEIGIYQRGLDAWLVLATAHELTASAEQTGASQAGASVSEAPRPARVANAAGLAQPHEPEPAAPLEDATVPTPTPDSVATTAPANVAAGAKAFVPVPKSSLSPILATRALQLVNNVRAKGTRCGTELFGPAPPVTLSGTLASVAFGHASDMAINNYFEHEDLNGNTPSDRVRATGYKEKLVGENIAYGPKSVDEVVQGWLDSPGHCENIMDPRFVEMGIGYATSQDPKHALYWVQVLATPRNLTASTRTESR